MAAGRDAGTDEATSRLESIAVRVAAGLFLSLGAAFGGGAAWAIAHLRRTGELPMTRFGFRALSGPFEALGTRWFSVLGVALVAVCTLDILAGASLWRGRRSGFRLGLATTAPALILATGFALPFLLVGVPLRVVLALAGRRTLK